uniref:Nucleoplasmin-like domain-containing protein n=1 Tax=Timema genevievae TaxID=629358 RepID=A0A7R9PQK6_TIMGE|nr:unnamed protein product [Timema genevievae]
MACLEINNNDNDFVPVFIDVEDREYIVCNLHKNKMIQVQLDLTFAVGDKIAFYTTGKSKIHLTVDGNSQHSVMFPIATKSTVLATLRHIYPSRGGKEQGGGFRGVGKYGLSFSLSLRRKQIR